MFNKALVKIFAVLASLSLVFTITLVAYGEESQPVDTPSPSTPVETSSVVETPSESAPVSSETEVSSQESSIEQQPITSSEVVSTESTVSSQEQIVSSQVSSVEVSSVENTKDTESSKKSNTSSKKKKPNKDKGTTSKKQNVSSNKQPQSQVTSYYTPSYDAGSMSDKWEGEETVLEETSSVRELSKHLTNPKKELLKWIWLPILIALLCIGALIYINVYVYGGKHNPFTKKVSKVGGYTYGDDFVYLDGDDDVHLDDEDYLQKENSDQDDDPFSADNFFHFDNE